ncbi:hypothetical protein [Streptomyces sp. NPDC054887]
MIAIWWVTMLVALGVGWAIWRLIRFPGGWTYAFHEEHKEERQALAAARNAVRELRVAARRETWQARIAVKRAEWAYRRRVRRAEFALEQRRTPHCGARIEQLGGIILHEHAVFIGGDEVPLASVGVRFKLARSKHVSYVYLKQPDGQERMERYEGKDFPEEAVRRFSIQIQNAAVAAQRLQRRRARDIRTLKAELDEAQKATQAIAVAQERLEKTLARHDADIKLPQAREALDDARKAWQDVTGRRPH